MQHQNVENGTLFSTVQILISFFSFDLVTF